MAVAANSHDTPSHATWLNATLQRRGTRLKRRASDEKAPSSNSNMPGPVHAQLPTGHNGLIQCFMCCTPGSNLCMQAWWTLRHPISCAVSSLGGSCQRGFTLHP